MNNSTLKSISSELSFVMDKQDNEEQTKQLIELLYSLLNELGYTENMINSPGAHTESNEVAFDLALKSDGYDDSSVKVYLKIVDKGADLVGYEDIISQVATYESNFGIHKTKYFLICNLYAIKVYAVTPGVTSLVTLDDNFEIIQMDNLLDHLETLNLLSVSPIKMKTMDLEPEPDPEPIKEPEPEKPKIEFDKNLLTKIGMIFAGIVILFLVISFLFKGNKEETPPVQNQSQTQTNVNINVNEQIPNQELTNSIDTESYLTIKSVLDLSVNNEVLKVDLISDLVEGTIVKIGAFCGDDTYYTYMKINSKGQGSVTYEIPSTWGEELITVGAYLKFNEGGYSQPASTISKYGANGEYIAWNKDYSKDMLTYSTINHSNALVIALKEQAERERNQALANAIKKDFASIDTRVDNFGNIKHVPLGYSFDETNISEKVNIYPMIYYDAASKTSYFYIICGYVGTQFMRFEEIGFSADGYNWTYQNSTNVKKNQVVGNKKAEWIYFNHIDSPVLLGDMDLFCNSNQVSMSLIGSINKTFNIDKEQLYNIKLFLAIFEKYYGNGTTIPDVSWFDMKGTAASLTYIQKPTAIYQRGYKEIESLKSYSNSLTEKRLNGQEVTKEEEELLATMNKTYRTTSPAIYNKIMDMIHNADAELIFYDDYETNYKYMKLYFVYADNYTNIESGFIPYINIYEDCTVLVPVRTITSSTTKLDEVYAKFTISSSLYNEIITYYDSKSYEQIK